MEQSPLQFPDARRTELESTIVDLVERAQRVLTAQGRLRSLLEASRAVVEDLDLERVLKRIAEAAVTLVDARYGALGVISGDRHLERFIHVGIPAADVPAIGHLPEGHGLLGAVIDTGEPIRLEHLGDDPRSVGFPDHHPDMDAFLGVPIRVRNEVFGNLYLTNRKDGPFTAEDEELVEAFAATAGIAIENARLYEEARRRQKLSDALSEVTAALLSPGTGDVLGVVAERVASVIPARLVTIVVPGPGENEVRIDTARGVDAAELNGVTFPATDSLAARAMLTGTIVTAQEEYERTLLGGRVRLGPTLAAPLIASGTSIGALCVSRSADAPAFTAAELTTVSEFAVQAGLAIALAWARLDRQRLDVIEDRTRIARDLHDHVIQRLFATGLGLQALSAADPAHAAALDLHVTEIDSAIADIRTAVFALTNRPGSNPPRTRHRLLDIVSELTPTLATAPRITFAGPVDLILIDQLADDVIAVVRECLANVARHAHAETTVIDVVVNDREVTVTIDDDGDGLDSTRDRASGTRNLRHRAENHGGTFTLEPRETRGTRARWNVPIPAGDRP